MLESLTSLKLLQRSCYALSNLRQLQLIICLERDGNLYSFLFDDDIHNTEVSTVWY